MDLSLIKKCLLINFDGETSVPHSVSRILSGLESCAVIKVIESHPYPSLIFKDPRVIHQSIHSYRSGNDRDNLQSKSLCAARNWIAETSSKFSIFSRDASDAKEIYELLESAIASIFTNGCADLFLYEKIVEEEKPNLIIFIESSDNHTVRGEHYKTDRFKQIARAKGIPTLEFRPDSIFGKIARKLRKIELRFRSKKTLKATNSKAASKPEIFLMGYDFPADFSLAAEALQGVRDAIGVRLFIFEGMPVRMARIIEIAAQHKITCEWVPRKKNEIMINLEGLNRMSERDVFCKAAWPEVVWSLGLSAQHFRNVEILLERRPLAVILPDERTLLQKYICKRASELNIKTVILPHYLRQLNFPRSNTFISNSHASNWFVLGDKVKESLVALGVKPEKILVTGLPGFQVSAKPALARAKHEEYKVRILWALQGFAEEAFFFREIVSWIQKSPDYLFVFRKHPRFRGQKFPKINLKNVKWDKAGELTKELSVCDVLITGTSITAFQAILHNKPVIIFNPFRREYPFPFLTYRAAQEAQYISEVAQFISRILSDAELSETLKRGREEVCLLYTPRGDADPQKIIPACITALLEGMPAGFYAQKEAPSAL